MFVVFYFAALGAILASFIGVIVERAYTGQSWKHGRSRCDSCAHRLHIIDLVPILSWLSIRGHCRYCNARIPVASLVFEIVLAALFVSAYCIVGITLLLPVLLVFLCVLLFIVRYDLRHTIVPPVASFVLVVLALLYACFSSVSSAALGAALMGAGGIGLLFLALHVLSRGRAMGLGDAPVAAALALLSAPNAYSGLLFSFWIGALYGIVLLCVRRGGPRMGIEVPFVPFMAIGFLLAYFTGWNILNLVLG